MKRYNVEVRTDVNGLWDSEAICDYIVADSAEEAKDYARQYLIDAASNEELIDEIGTWGIRAREVICSEYEVEEYGEWL